MPDFFEATPEATRALQELADEIPGIQQTLVDNHKELTRPDRGAHQQQIAGSLVRLRVAAALPPELAGLGLFTPGAEHIGIGRISTGLGCPHLETDPDFLGLMVAFRAGGQRVDFITINDPTAPTDTPEQFIALLKATADAAGTEIPAGNIGSLDIPNVLASQAVLVLRLARYAGLAAAGIATHVVAQTSRTVLSSSACQQYWTGIVRAREVLGKFTFVSVADANRRRGLTPPLHHFSTDWKTRQSAGPIDFRLYWIPYRNDRETSLTDLTTPWHEDHRLEVGVVSFPQSDPASHDAKMAALLAAEMGANPGNWLEGVDGEASPLPSTRYTAARMLVYQRSQEERHALAPELYNSVFDTGLIPPALAEELTRRYRAKVSAGHYVPDVAL